MRRFRLLILVLRIGAKKEEPILSLAINCRERAEYSRSVTGFDEENRGRKRGLGRTKLFCYKADIARGRRQAKPVYFLDQHMAKDPSSLECSLMLIFLA